MPDSKSLLRPFARGDYVRLVTGDDMDGFVGKITRRAHPASPWTWVVFNLAGARPIWSRAVTEEDIEHAA